MYYVQLARLGLDKRRHLLAVAGILNFKFGGIPTELFFYHGGKPSRLPFNGCQDEFSRPSARGGARLRPSLSHTPSFERFLTTVFSAQHLI